VIAAGVIPMAVGAVTAPAMTPVPMGPIIFVAPPSGAPVNGQSTVVFSSLAADQFGQLTFVLNTGVNGTAGTYVIGITNVGSTVILAQATVVTTSVTGLVVPRTGDVPAITTTGPTFAVGG